MSHGIGLGLLFVALGALAGCAPDYSPDKYSATAVQQANKVDKGVVIGVRNVGVTASGTVGAAAGAAAGGIAGAQTPGGGASSAFGALGGALVGGLIGTSVEHVVDDTTAYEYIVRKPNGELVSVTQKDKTPLAVGANVLVIAGNQARIVPDYTVADTDAAEQKDKPAAATPSAGDTTPGVPAPSPVTATPLAAPKAATAAAGSSTATQPSGPDAGTEKAVQGAASSATPAAATTPVQLPASAAGVEKAVQGAAAAGASGLSTGLLPAATSLLPAGTGGN